MVVIVHDSDRGVGDSKTHRRRRGDNAAHNATAKLSSTITSSHADTTSLPWAGQPAKLHTVQTISLHFRGSSSSGGDSLSCNSSSTTTQHMQRSLQVHDLCWVLPHRKTRLQTAPGVFDDWWRGSSSFTATEKEDESDRGGTTVGNKRGICANFETAATLQKHTTASKC